MNTWVGSFKPTPHVFGDMMEQSCATVDPSWSFKEKARAVNTSAMNTSQFCFTHGGHCPILKPADVNLSGLPCPDFSKANKNRKFLDGKHSQVFCVWCRHHREVQTPLAILENTPEFQLQIQVLQLSPL